MSKVRLLLLRSLVALTLLTGVGEVHATQLRLHFKNERGDAVRLTKAELALVGWGELEYPIALDTDGRELILDLSETWLRSRADVFEGIDVYLLLQADGYAAIRSEPFRWMGGGGPPNSSFVGRVVQTTIRIPKGRRIVVPEGESVEAEVVFYKAIPRFLRLMDDRGKPVQGVRVTSFAIWSASNHCGALETRESVATHVSDRDGRVPVPDGNFEYAFLLDLDTQRQALQPAALDAEGSTDKQSYFTGRLVDKETQVVLHSLRVVPLTLRVWTANKPDSGEILWGRPEPCPCGGACVTKLATSDGDGWLRIPDFRPEKWSGVFFGDEDRPLWEVDPGKLPRTGVISVRLKSNAASQPTASEGAAER